MFFIRFHEILLSAAHRRIRIVEVLDDTIPVEEEQDVPHVSRINGRRTRTQKKSDPKLKKVNENAKKIDEELGKDIKDDSAAPADPIKPEDKKIILVRTENLANQPVEKTIEIKASMQAIVQNIRDIVQYSPLFGQQINLLLHPSQHVIENPVYLCDLVATLVQSADTNDLQQMLEEEHV